VAEPYDIGERAELIPNLMWTNVAASMFVGSKGVLGPGNAAGSDTPRIPVTPSAMTVKIHFLFALPASLACLRLLLVLLPAIVNSVSGYKNLDRMRLPFQQLSPGRIFTTILFNDLGGMAATPRDWSKRIGDRIIDLLDPNPSAAV
jgi:hypothetical protein